MPLGIAYTGCSTSALFETLSKVGTKLMLAHAGLPTPGWSTDGTGINRDASVIVKALWEHGSLGLDETSVMRCEDAPRIVAARTLRLKTEHFAEAYIEGREFNLALLERISGVDVPPIAEILFGGLEATCLRSWASTQNGRLIARRISAHRAASVWNGTSLNLPRRSGSSH
jgi:D-alanine-D-alanine ligase